MMRFLIHLTILVLAIIGALYVAYGEVEPCRVLAVESSRRSAVPGAIAQPLAQIVNSDESQMQCVGDLLSSWGERIKAALP